MFKELIERLSNRKETQDRYFLYHYTKSDGSFDYEQYKAVQIQGNKSKIDRSWVRQSDIDFLSSYIKSKIANPSFGICHGTRRGLEQKWFSQNLSCKVIGTEISDTATDYENTVQWDFHEENKEWIESADFVYSNSFDHSYDPRKALCNWMGMLKKGGICIIEHTEAHTVKETTKLDPFGASLEIMPFLVLEWGKGAFSVREILHTPADEEGGLARNFLVISNNE